MAQVKNSIYSENILEIFNKALHGYPFALIVRALPSKNMHNNMMMMLSTKMVLSKTPTTVACNLMEYSNLLAIYFLTKNQILSMSRSADYRFLVCY